MAEICEDCGSPRATTAHEQATDGYCWQEVPCLRRQLTAATARAEAAEAKVRDVETLDGWGDGLSWTCSPPDEGRHAQCTLEDDCSTFEHFDGETPAEARAAAAQWVRENSPPQKKPTDEGGRGDGQ